MIHALRTRVHGQMRDACQAPGSCPWHATQGIAPIRHRSAVWRACNEAARGQRSHPLRNLPTSQAAVPPPTPVVRGRPCTCLTPLILPPPFSLRPHHPQAQASSSIECNAAGHRAHGAGRRATLARQRAFPTGLRDMPADAAEQLRRQRAASCRGADAPCSKSPLKRNVAGPCVQLEMGAWGMSGSSSERGQAARLGMHRCVTAGRGLRDEALPRCDRLEGAAWMGMQAGPPLQASTSSASKASPGDCPPAGGGAACSPGKAAATAAAAGPADLVSAGGSSAARLEGRSSRCSASSRRTLFISPRPRVWRPRAAEPRAGATSHGVGECSAQASAIHWHACVGASQHQPLTWMCSDALVTRLARRACCLATSCGARSHRHVNW